MHGIVGSVDTLRTRPPALSAWPDGVRSGYVGVCGFVPNASAGDCGAEGPRAGDGLRDAGSDAAKRSGGSAGRLRGCSAACANRGETKGGCGCGWWSACG